jgi:hypothetical protein
MSIFSNSFASAKGDARAYVEAVLGLLQDRNPYEVLKRTPEEAEAILGRISPDRLREPEAPGKWSAHEVVHHLADSELVWALRIRRVLADDRAVIRGYDQDLWARRLRYLDRPIEGARDTFRHLRGANLTLLSTLSREELARTGTHSERGEERLDHMIRLYAGHDLVHLRQLRRIQDAFAARTPAG